MKSLRGLPFDVIKGMDWLAENSQSKAVEDLDFPRHFSNSHGTTAKKIVVTAEYLVTLDRISDTIVAESFRASWQT